MWNRDRIRKEIHNLPADITVSKFQFFNPRKCIIFGYCPISRKPHLTKMQRDLTYRSGGWEISFNMIGIRGRKIDSYIEPVLAIFPQKNDIKTIDIDLDVKSITIHYSEKKINMTTSILEPLVALQKEINLQIKMNFQNEVARSVSSYLEEIKQSFSQSIPEASKPDIDNKIYSLLPNWVIEPEIQQNEKGELVLLVKNTLDDIERLQFLTMLLESQMGITNLKIKQQYTIEDQIASLKEHLNMHFQDYSIIKNSESAVTVSYRDFPKQYEFLESLKKSLLNKTQLNIYFESIFEAESEKTSLKIKHFILSSFPDIDFTFVYYNSKNQSFEVLLPEEIQESIQQSVIKEALSEKYTYPFELKWMENDPVIYLKKRIFYTTERKKLLQRIKYDHNNRDIRIYYKNPAKNVDVETWKDIFFRFAKFNVEFVDSITKKHLNIFEFDEYIKNLEPSDLSEYLIKLLPSNIAIQSINYENSIDAFVIKYDNLLLKDQLKTIKAKIKSQLKIETEFLSAREPDNIIYSIVSTLPEWLILPRVTYNEEQLVVNIKVQNDFEEESQIQKLFNEQSLDLQIPIELEIYLPVQRIKNIILKSCNNIIEITRLKIYNDKSQIYMEGIVKQNEEEAIEEIINQIETKTKYSVEFYIKQSKPYKSRRQTVHDLLKELMDTYEFSEDFPINVLKEVDDLESFSVENHLKDRVDLRNWNCFSIDPIGTYTIDDCISVEKLTHDSKEDDILIGIHVADVSAFVKKYSSLELEAKRRSTAVYFPNNNYYPLFPSEFLNFVGLQENNDRLAISLLIQLNTEGHIADFWIKQSVIQNKKQFNYNEANLILANQNNEDEYFTDLSLLLYITNQLRYQRISHGSINLEFVPDNPTNQIITELMILANRLVAFHLQISPGQKIFRNQHIPSYAYPAIKKTLSAYNYHLDILNKHPLTDLNRILSEAAIRGEEQLIIQELRKFLSNAYYSHTSNGHEALGTKWYTQWTSPLRRYMDLLVQRLLFSEGFVTEDLVNQCQYASAVERLIKIKIDQSKLSKTINQIENYIDKPLNTALVQLNQQQALFKLSALNMLIITPINQHNVNHIDENLEVNGEIILKDDDKMRIVLNKVNFEKRDIYVQFSLLTSADISAHQLSIKGKILLSKEYK